MPVDYSAQIARISSKLKLKGEVAIRAMGLESLGNLIEATPVDTTHAESNWIAVVGGGDPPRAPVGSREAVDRGPQNAGILAVASYVFGQGVIKIGNAVSYLSELDQGSSVQAPAGFVRAAFEAAVVAARAAWRQAVVPRDPRGRFRPGRPPAPRDGGGRYAEIVSHTRE